MAIKCCNGCVPPKRSPTCHGTCLDYIKEKAKHDAEAAEDYKRRSIKTGLMIQQERGVNKAAKRKRKSKGGHYES